MNSARLKACCAAVLGVIAISCRFRYEDLELPLSDDGNDATSGGQTSSGSPSSGGTSSESGGAAGADAVTTGGANAGTSGSVGTSGSDGTSGSGGPNGGGGTSGSGGGQGICVPDATCSCDVFQGHEYRFCAVLATRAVGEAACQSANMVLARVDSAEENAYLLQQFTDRGMFMGSGSPIVILDGSDSQVEGMWRWNDGTLFWNNGPVGTFYTNWGTPPKTGQGDCVGMTTTGTWGDRACNSGNATVACESP